MPTRLWAPACVVVACAALAVAAGASGGARAGGFLYSQYLKDDASAGGPVAAGSFVVRAERPVFDAGNFMEDAAAQLDSLPLNEWAAGYASEGRGALDASLAGQAQIFADMAAGHLAMVAQREGRARGFVRDISFEFQSELGGRRAHAGLTAIGSLFDRYDEVLAWQARGYVGGRGTRGGNTGLIYRRSLSETGRGLLDGVMAGFNTFVDFEKSSDAVDADEFWRWSLGLEMRSAWVDVLGNYYQRITDRYFHEPRAGERQEQLASYSAEGYDMKVAVHSPQNPDLSASLGYYTWRGRFGDPGRDGFRAGLRYQPATHPWMAEIEYQTGGDFDTRLGGRVGVDFQFGVAEPTKVGTVTQFRVQDWFYRPAEREYVQRIFTAGSSPYFVWSIASIQGSRQTVAVTSSSITATVTYSGSALNIERDGNVSSSQEWVLPSGDDIALAMQNEGGRAALNYATRDGGAGAVVLGAQGIAGESAAVVAGARAQIRLERGALSVSVTRAGHLEVRLGETDSPAGGIMLSEAGSHVYFQYPESGEKWALIGAGTDLPNINECRQGARNVGGVNYYCAIDAFFQDRRGNRVEEGQVLEIYTNQGAEVVVATLRALRGANEQRGFAFTRRSPVDAEPCVRFDENTGEVSVNTTSSAGPCSSNLGGSMFQIQVGVNDNDDPAGRTPEAIRTLNMRVIAGSP